MEHSCAGNSNCTPEFYKALGAQRIHHHGCDCSETRDFFKKQELLPKFQVHGNKMILMVPELQKPSIRFWKKLQATDQANEIRVLHIPN